MGMLRLVNLTFSVALLCLLGVLAITRQAAAQGWISFNESGTLTVIQADGQVEYAIHQSGLASLVAPLSKHLPQWSPNGAVLAFYDEQSTQPLCFFHLAGMHTTCLNPIPSVPLWDYGFAWLPDGRAVLMTADLATSLALLRVDAYTHRVEPFANPDASLSTFTPPAPNEQWVTFVGSDGKLQRIRLYSEALKPITNIDVYLVETAVSPDGEWVLLSYSLEGGWATKAVMRPDGSDLRQVFAEPVEQWHWQAWSPDNQLLLVDSERQQLVLIAPDTLTHQPLGNPLPVGSILEAEWSPDGQWLVISAYAEGAFRLYRLRVGEASLQPLRQSPYPMMALAWSPPVDRTWHAFWLVILGVGGMLAILVLKYLGKNNDDHHNLLVKNRKLL